MTGIVPNAEQRANLLAWLRYCEAHPVLWERGEIEIPLAQVGLTYDEMVELFEQPTLAEVRRAVEEFLDAAYIAEHGDDDLETGNLRDPEGDEAAHG